MSLNNINQLIFVMMKICVFFSVRIELLNITETSFAFKVLNVSLLQNSRPIYA